MLDGAKRFRSHGFAAIAEKRKHVD